MSRPANIIIEGRAYRWRDILDLRRQQVAAWKAARPDQPAFVPSDRGHPPQVRAHRRRSLRRAVLARLPVANQGANGRHTALMAYVNRAAAVAERDLKLALGSGVAATLVEFTRDRLLQTRFLSLDRIFACSVLRVRQPLVFFAVMLRANFVRGIESEAQIVLRRLAFLNPLVEALLDGFLHIEPLAAHLAVFAV